LELDIILFNIRDLLSKFPTKTGQDSDIKFHDSSEMLEK
jgi:hypothetical protein